MKDSLFHQSPPGPQHPKTAGASLLRSTLHERFGFSSFRTHQQEVCEAAFSGKDLLLVMPTGAGKSLCYQLPVVARPGARAIIITPLLALIEDQVEKLHIQGISAERIHSGRSRQESQDACRAWREGQLNFLFIAPERLAIPGFMDFLELHRPTTIAVDEAHCISCWGHDFRHEYRMLGPRLERLRPANIIAVTATATAEVQKDIIVQLGLPSPKVFIHGFRRTNIAIEVMSLNPSARPEACRVLLKPEERRPAIIYAPTRKIAESTAETLNGEFRASAFHAGLPAAQRQEIQTQFMRGEVDVMVATIAFGMGIDKSNIRTVVHTALPSSVEGYYQEIGRAGRDGKPADAIMMYSPIDMKTHEYFFDVNYPEASILQKMLDRIPTTGIDRQGLLELSDLEEPSFNPALQKLWIHGGVSFDEQGIIRQGDTRWVPRYNAQRRHKQGQMSGVLGFAKTAKCRMLQFLDHFGDREDNHGPCGICDICLGSRKVNHNIEAFTTQDRAAQRKILVALRDSLSRTFGQVFKELFEASGSPRRHMEALVDDLVTQKVITCRSDSFEKDGKKLAFKWLELTDSGRIWLHQAGLGPSLRVQHKNLEPKKASASRRRNQKKRTSSSVSRSF
ncbi:MAG: ATP-dependent DNA helicase [Proteobacteria bacterium]|nr:ATP-dependent DNA helicase [Pseudomonadota bacterium]